jgi:hypothetical protein
MNTEEIIDYALPCMMAEKDLKQVHELMLANNHHEAINKCRDALFRIEELIRSIQFMKDKEENIQWTTL